MSRSLKKGPYIDPKLMKKIEAMNVKAEKKVIRTSRRNIASYSVLFLSRMIAGDVKESSIGSELERKLFTEYNSLNEKEKLDRLNVLMKNLR